MLQDPRREIHDIIREFGRRKKIFNIHFRNIRGHRDDFQEVYPDEGDMDMLQVALTLQEVGYEFMLMPDHVPAPPRRPARHAGLCVRLRLYRRHPAGCRCLRHSRAVLGEHGFYSGRRVRPSRADCFSARTSRIVSRACSGVMIGSTVSPATARAKCSISRE